MTSANSRARSVICFPFLARSCLVRPHGAQLRLRREARISATASDAGAAHRIPSRLRRRYAITHTSLCRNRCASFVSRGASHYNVTRSSVLAALARFRAAPVTARQTERWVLAKQRPQALRKRRTDGREQADANHPPPPAATGATLVGHAGPADAGCAVRPLR